MNVPQSLSSRVSAAAMRDAELAGGSPGRIARDPETRREPGDASHPLKAPLGGGGKVLVPSRTVVGVWDLGRQILFAHMKVGKVRLALHYGGIGRLHGQCLQVRPAEAGIPLVVLQVLGPAGPQRQAHGWLLLENGSDDVCR